MRAVQNNKQHCLLHHGMALFKSTSTIIIWRVLGDSTRRTRHSPRSAFQGGQRLGQNTTESINELKQKIVQSTNVKQSWGELTDPPLWLGAPSSSSD